MGRQIVPISMMTAAGRRIVTDWKQDKNMGLRENHMEANDHKRVNIIH